MQTQTGGADDQMKSATSKIDALYMQNLRC